MKEYTEFGVRNLECGYGLAILEKRSPPLGEMSVIRRRRIDDREGPTVAKSALSVIAVTSAATTSPPEGESASQYNQKIVVRFSGAGRG